MASTGTLRPKEKDEAASYPFILPNRALPLPLKINGVVLQNLCSKQLLMQMMNSTGTHRPFEAWSSSEKDDAIRKCGLASSKFKTEPERNSILTKLVSMKLPLHPGVVAQKLNQMGILHTHAISCQQKAWTLLNKMSPKMPCPVPPSPPLEVIAREPVCVHIINTVTVSNFQTPETLALSTPLCCA